MECSRVAEVYVLLVFGKIYVKDRHDGLEMTFDAGLDSLHITLGLDVEDQSFKSCVHRGISRCLLCEQPCLPTHSVANKQYEWAGHFQQQPVSDGLCAFLAPHWQVNSSVSWLPTFQWSSPTLCSKDPSVICGFLDTG